MDTPLIIADKTFRSRFLLGTGKFKNKADLKASILSSVAGLTAKIVAIQQHLNQVRDVEPLGKADAQAMDKLKLTLAGIDPHMPQTV